MLTEKQVDGVIMLSYDCCPQTLDALKRSGLPTALISTLCTDDAFITINISNFDAAYQAVEHLIGLGHRSIAMLAGPPSDIDGGENRLLEMCIRDRCYLYHAFPLSSARFRLKTKNAHPARMRTG